MAQEDAHGWGTLHVRRGDSGRFRHQDAAKPGAVLRQWMGLGMSHSYWKWPLKTWIFPLNMVDLSIAMLVYQRVLFLHFDILLFFFYIIFVHQKKSFRGLWCSIRHVSPGDFCVLRVECGPFPRRSATSDVRCAVWSATAPSSTRSLAPWRRASTWRSSRGSKGCRRADCTSTCCGDAMEWWNGVVDITLDMHVFAMVCAFSVFFAGWITSSFWSFRS